MKILAVDSSGQVASVALVTEDTVLAEYSVDFKKTHSESLLPMIDEVLRMTETEGTSLDAIAVAAGPGSFTGLRIGASTVKGLAAVWEKPVVAVPTVDGIAANFAGSDRLICPIMDARRGQVYTGLYEFEGNRQKVLLKQDCRMLLDVLSEIMRRKDDREVVFCGDGVPVYRKEIDEKLAARHSYAPMHLLKQRAASVGFLAAAMLREGLVTDAIGFVPEYCRKSQAERELQEKNAGLGAE